MNLQQYLDEEIMAIRQFAKNVGVREQSIYNWLYKDVQPIRIHKLLIQQITNGKVTVEDWENVKKKADKRVRGSKVNGMQSTQRVDVNKKAKPKVSKKR